MKAQRLSRWISQGTCKAGYGPFRLNNIGHHSSRRYYRGGWHRSCPALANTRFLGEWTDPQYEDHSMFPYRSCLHCRVFAPAAPRRAWIRVSESISGLLLPQPVLITGLTVHYTHYYLIGRRPILGQTNPFYAESIPAYVRYPELSPVSRGYAGPKGRLSTCY